MKVGLILFLAKYYHRISIENINKLKYLFTPVVALIAPVLLVVTQPDLVTSLLIASSVAAVAWLAGVRLKFFEANISYASFLQIFNFSHQFFVSTAP